MHIWWTGQSGFLIQFERAHLLLDPYLSDSLTEKYAGSPTPHDRMSTRVVAPEQLAFVDIVTSSHGHTDHLDNGTLPGVLSNGARLVCAAGSEDLAEQRAGAPPFVALAPGGRVSVGPFDIHAVPACHEGAAEAVGYVVRAGDRWLYHSGDTIADERVLAAVRPFGVDVAFLPINGRLGNMSAVDAANAALQIAARLVIPCHFDMFSFNTADPRSFERSCKAIGQACRVLELGERLDLAS